MEYQKTTLREEFEIKKIVTVHYFEYMRDYIYEGESHDFWEFVYVDKGIIEISADDRKFSLRQGEIAFHKPGEFHALKANGQVAPNLVVVSFECFSPQMKFFCDKIFKISGEHKECLVSLVKEAKLAFASPLSDPDMKALTRRKDDTFGAEQIIKLLLELLLIKLYRSNYKNIKNEKPMSAVIEKIDRNVAEELIEYMYENINQTLVFSDFTKVSNLSPTRLKTIFKQRMGMGVVQYFKKLKIERAKLYMRENDYNFTQIAMLLGYDSIHTFSRQFKAIEGMPPRDYAKSVKFDL